MDNTASAQKPLDADETTLRLVELAEEALRAQSFEAFIEGVLPAVAGMMRSSSAFLYVGDSRLAAPRLFQYGFASEVVSGIERLCGEQFDHVSSRPSLQPVTVTAAPLDATLNLYPLHAQEANIGLIRREQLLQAATGTAFVQRV